MQLFGRHDLVGQPDAQRFLGAHLAPGDHQLFGSAGADRTRQALRASPTRDDAQQDLGLPEHCPLAGDAIVARQRQLAPATERVSTDRGDHESRDRGDRVERRVEPCADDFGLGCATELADVGTSGEDAFAARDHDGTGRIRRQLDCRRMQFGEHFARQRVHLGIVQRDDCDAIGAAVEQDKISHRRNIARWTNRSGFDGPQHLVGSTPWVE